MFDLKRPDHSSVFDPRSKVTLIYGLPLQTLQSWRETLDLVVALCGGGGGGGGLGVLHCFPLMAG